MGSTQVNPIPHTDKQYRKQLRTYKFVIYMALAALFVIGVGLVLGLQLANYNWLIMSLEQFASYN